MSGEAETPVTESAVPAPAEWAELAPTEPFVPVELVGELTVPAAWTEEPRTAWLETARWCALGASVRGRAHAHRGAHRDDALAMDGNARCLVLAVADGAGSASLSRVGAALVTDRVVQAVMREVRAAAAPTEALVGTAISHAVHAAATELHALATGASLEPSVFRTTLLVAAVLATDAGEVLLAAQIGDGALLVAREDGQVQRVGAAKRDAWAGEVDCFVPDPCCVAQGAALRRVPLDDVTLLALMTDGVDDPFHPLEHSGAALVAQWQHGSADAIGTAEQPERGPVVDDHTGGALLRWLQFRQRGEVDDRTLLLAWRRGGA